MTRQESVLQIDVRFEPEDGIFIAEVNELAGCVAMGTTLEQLAANLKTAIADYLELFEDAEDVCVGELVLADDDVAPGSTSDVRRHSEVRVLAGAC